MSRLLEMSPVLAVGLYQFVGGFCRFNTGVMRPLILGLTLIIMPLLDTGAPGTRLPEWI